MPAPRIPSSYEAGQMFAAWVVGLFIVSAMILYVTDEMRRARNDTQSMVYRELALNIAKAGFEDGLSYFRTHSSGCYLNSSEAPTSQSWVTPWPTYPDAAFLPQSTDTDFYSNISQSTTLGTCAKGIIGDFSMNQYVTYTGADQMTGSSLWGRYVIRRQNTQNWSPGPDTAAANTDADACHDLSSIATQSALGSGTRWSIVSHGYLVRLPEPVTTTSYTSSLLGTAAAYQGDDLLSAPMAYYNNQPFLLAQARVYGELSRINFNLPGSAILLPLSSDLTVNTNGILTDGVNGAAWTAETQASCTNCGSGSVTGSENPASADMAPTIANCFPGQSWSSLRNLAQSLEAPGGQIEGYVGGIEQLPVFESTNTTTGEAFSTQVNEPAFYFLDTSISLAADSGDVPVLSGVGLCIVEGNLTIPTGNNSSWDGVLYVEGNVILDGPTSITGILISQGTISIGNSTDLNKTTVSYDSGSITLVQTLLKTFTVDSSSIVATEF